MQHIYQIQLPQKSVTLVNNSLKVAQKHYTVVPMLAGQEISWSIA
ncbi:MAG: hypothetical protein AAF652_02540 [Cyanobacteria bacterium P01_C01_bin.72]